MVQALAVSLAIKVVTVLLAAVAVALVDNTLV